MNCPELPPTHLNAPDRQTYLNALERQNVWEVAIEAHIAECQSCTDADDDECDRWIWLISHYNAASPVALLEADAADHNEPEPEHHSTEILFMHDFPEEPGC